MRAFEQSARLHPARDVLLRLLVPRQVACNKLSVVFLEAVGDVLKKDEAENDVLVFRSVHVVAQLVGGEPELGLEAELGGGFLS